MRSFIGRADLLGHHVAPRRDDLAADAIRTTIWTRSAIRGSSSIRAWKSEASSTSRLVRVVARTVAERRARREHRDLAEEMADAERDAFAVEFDADFAIGDEYMEWAASPRRTMTSRAFAAAPAPGA